MADTEEKNIRMNSFKPEKFRSDTRLSGTAAEYILSCLLRNKFQIFTQRFDVEGFDIIAFDLENRFFRGKSPVFVQVKIRSGKNPTGISFKEYENVGKLAKRLRIQLESVYLAFGSFENDIRKIKFFIIPWMKIPRLLISRTKSSYRFEARKMEGLVQEGEIISI